ncbi:MAG: tetratricopeptide repeat protein [Duncaniella sp.]|nr:tetratricopeptide repeat protein [Bacteroides sp.]MDE5827386.1 tetratricopeptide repeat protein [Duncaniella sp.]MDE6429947.1 tetratricopeptide repeat protein [Duncaniella sp.]MDE6823819.1 tetratricopeptide repeat protein [Duncaniella sp.]MDE7475118.1 tetratricopeptide repeat protein [Duncaniella sp.]
MKKICVLTAGLFAAASMTAQVAVVKDAEKAFKSVDSYAAYQKALQIITPAFTNPETDKDAQTFWIPGKAGFKLYDDLFAKKTFGQDVNLVDMSNALLDGYTYGMKALAVDTVVDAKGKVKTKFSKDIASQISGHFNDFVNAGAAYWEAHDYKKAYEAFNDYLEIPGNPRLGKNAPAALPDSTATQIMYNAALAAWQAEMLPQAAATFDKLLSIGYDDPNAYDYAFSVAYQMQDEPRKLQYSQAALDKFGTSDPKFLQRIVNSYIESKDFEKAKTMLNNAIAADPNNAAYYLSLGVLLEQQNDAAGAKEAYQKAVNLDGENALNNFYYGRALLQEYDALDQAAANMSQQEYNKYNYEKMRPIILDAAKYLEKSYQLDNEQIDALRYLKNIYYVLNDGDNLLRVEGLLGK